MVFRIRSHNQCFLLLHKHDIGDCYNVICVIINSLTYVHVMLLHPEFFCVEAGYSSIYHLLLKV